MTVSSNENNEKHQEENGFVEILNQKATKETIFQSQKAERLYNWWCSFHPNCPTIDNFDILHHIHDAGEFFLYKVISRDEYEIRLNGEVASDIIRKQYSGVTVSAETAKDDPHLLSLIPYLQQIYDDKEPYVCTGKFRDRLDRLRHFQSIDCPLLDENSKVVQIIGILEALD
ncbi:hypothetical protein [Curvivirga aplysinae]|uniref:hypothetical protein n=1 Tax=Curvivirga aplysinae TaxID=2529852 RepID=UPI0012BD368B|nr:hypothetical protein [Curvivirga aplysinae]MTI09365.1 hypothetical protein [Curvivirga aplysinae]